MISTKNLRFFILMALLLFIGRLMAQDGNYVEGEIYVKLKNGYTFHLKGSKEVNIDKHIPFLSRPLSPYGVTSVKAPFYKAKSKRLRQILRIQFARSEKVASLLRDLNKLVEVEYVEQVPLYKTTEIPNDLGANNTSGQWYLHKIGAPAAWDLADGSGIKIAVVDNAFDLDHEDLAGNLLAGYDVADDDSDPSAPSPSFTHGTQVAGLAGAVTDNGIGIASIGYNVKIIPVKATNDSGDPDFIPYGPEGVYWAAAAGADIINLSWGTPDSSFVSQEVTDYAYDQGALVVAAAGNSDVSLPLYPAAYDNVIAVAATSLDDGKAFFSNYGTWVDISAPGVFMQTSASGGSYASSNGTSMAAPLVAGLCGLLWSANPHQNRTTIVDCLLSTAVNIDSQNPAYAGQLGSGRIDAFAAIQCVIANACYSQLTLSSPEDDIDSPALVEHESSDWIQASNVIESGSNATYDATDYVILAEGFWTKSGGGFQALIDGCESSQSLEAGTMPKETVEEVDYQMSGTRNLHDGTELKYFPNPVSTTLNVEFQLDAPAVTSLKLLKGTGELIHTFYDQYSFKQGKHKRQLDVSMLQPGLYILILQIGDRTVSRKLILTGN